MKSDIRTAAQRLALPAWGGRVDSPSKRESAPARKMLKNAARTPSRVHAVLGDLMVFAVRLILLVEEVSFE